MAANATHLTRPLRVEEISKIAGDFPYDSETPFVRWIRSADFILKQAQSYLRDGDDQQAYIFYLRHALLLFEKLPEHPQAKLEANKKALANANRAVQADLKVLEDLRPRIARRHEEYAKVEVRRQEERRRIAEERARLGQLESDAAQDWDDLSQYQPAGSKHALKKSLAAEEHSDLAVKLARSERRRRKPTEHRPIEQYDGLWHRTAEEGRQQHFKQDNDTLSKSIVDVGRKSQHTLFDRDKPKQANGSSSNAAPAFYPTVPPKRDHSISKPLAPSHHENYFSHFVAPSTAPPTLPPKGVGLTSSIPPIPSNGTTSVQEIEPPRSQTVTPNVESQNYTFKPSAFTEDGTPLRTVWLPEQLRLSFLSLAAPNTSLNREFLGILCGTLISNAFFISKLVIPQQEATSDTCEMVEEGEISLWEYCDTEDLMTLGWIHTHPTQTCFMSSRDLHTHSGYQLQLAESIAVVCAPNKNPSWGVFRLTSPPGLHHIRDCRQPGIFHPHALPERDLYTIDGIPEHVKELANLPFEVIDLRK